MTGGSEQFAAKLELVLRALAISRGRLAADLGVNKSVVSRWLSGTFTPSGENLSQLTRFIATRSPGFIGLDWDRDLSGLAALFRGDASPAPSAPVTANVVQGFWHAWRIEPVSREVMRNPVMIRPGAGALDVSCFTDPVMLSGTMSCSDGRAWMTLRRPASDLPTSVLLYTCPGRQQWMDGLYLTVNWQASRGIAAAPLVLERFADLSASEADDRRIFDRLMAEPCFPGRDSVRDEIMRRIDSPDGWILRAGVETTLSRAARSDEVAAAAARTEALATTA